MSEQLLQTSIAQLQALESKPKSRFRKHKVLTINKEANSFLSVIEDNDIILNTKRTEVATQTPPYRNFNCLLLDSNLQYPSYWPDERVLQARVANLEENLQLRDKQIEFFRSRVKPETGQFTLKDLQKNEVVKEVDWLRMREASLLKQLMIQKTHIQSLEKTIREATLILQQKVNQRERFFWRTIQNQKHQVNAELHRLRQRQHQKLAKQSLNLDVLLKTLDSLLQTN